LFSKEKEIPIAIRTYAIYYFAIYFLENDELEVSRSNSWRIISRFVG